ncbi:CoxG family protein [Pararhizobium sp. DWP3-4]|uniref:CoxG family protein n=1 Tax=Pararhizobium sp. DWP3-4 TaxID=2804565 RepID=UPI003CEE7188
MEMKGEERIAAPRDLVWAALNDPDVLKVCIPGCTAIDRQSATDFTATLKVRIGPIPMTFSGNMTLSNIDAPHSYTLSGESAGGIAGLAKGRADVTLTADGEETILAYDATAEIGGKLAHLGSRLVGSSASKHAARFFSGFSDAARAKAMRKA